MTPLINIETQFGSQLCILGYQRMMDAIVKGEVLPDVLFGLARYQPKGDAPNFDMFNGALQCLLDSWSAMVNAGVTVTNENDKAIQNFLNGSKARMLCDLAQADAVDKNLLATLIHNLCWCVSNTRQSIRFVAPKPAPTTEKALAVRLVSSPDRVTVQTVQRDSDQEIVSTTTREIDAA
jgi:hypothetical protein